MKVFRTREGAVLEESGKYFSVDENNWDRFINDDDLFAKAQGIIKSGKAAAFANLEQGHDILPPMVSQELWGCGVTYNTSKEGRQEESKDPAGAAFYARAYEAERPEVFFKAMAHRVVGHGGKVRIRKDSTWDAPEPELTMMVTSSGKIVGYTIGNDMSSRSIEGENPLYLPQAKTYDGCASLGPCILLTNDDFPASAMIEMTVQREGKQAYKGSVNINRMRRSHKELVSYVFRECTFPQGCLVMTGTGVVPSSDFTLKKGDVVSITLEPIGTLTNTVDR